MKKVYLSGPMSGITMFNYPMFDAAATMLRKQGFDVVNPTETDSAEMREFSMTSKDGNTRGMPESWLDLITHDLRLLIDKAQGIDAIVMLPGWERSEGASLEKAVAETVGITVLFWNVSKGRIA